MNIAQENKQHVIDNPNKKTFKIWSEKTDTYYYQSRDPEFYRKYYHEKKERIVCEHCNRNVYVGNLRVHLKSNICAKRKALNENDLKKRDLIESIDNDLKTESKTHN